ncbi:hypothetical protein MLD38_030559 [Melastoma candidum]|uniref:Uncharacterized protein n=1 Tax=Melastoma candidum TaxID=119954 RepID=A0ACB9MN77_9MYRT|nr:hypothetical protein MLD38_030559 [Melastoma candidum]
MSSSSALFSLALLAALLSVPSSLAQTAPSPSVPSGPPNLTAILEKGGQYTFFIRLLNTTQVAAQIENQLNTSTEGLTVLAPTDNAFNALSAGTINNLSPEQQVQLVLYHVLPKFYSLQSFLTVSNPVRTQANYGLNFTGQGNQVNVSSGTVETQLNNVLYSQFPLATYELDKVLLPAQLFESPPPASSPPPPSKSGGSSTTATAPSTSDKSSGLVDRSWTSGAGVVVGVVLMVLMGGGLA